MIPYQFEPYNAYQRKPRKKHWMEIAEEEALFHRMVQEQLMREAKTAQMTVQDSVQNGESATTAGQAGGAGGVPPYSYFQETAFRSHTDIQSRCRSWEATDDCKQSYGYSPPAPGIAVSPR